MVGYRINSLEGKLLANIDIGILHMHYYATEISLYEVGLSKELPQTFPNGPEFQRLEILHACLSASKNLFETFFSFPVDEYFSFSVPSWSRFVYSLIILQSLSVFNHQEWNLDYVQQTLDFNEVVDRMIANFQNVATQPGFEDVVVFTRIAAKMDSLIKHHYSTSKGGGPAKADGVEEGDQPGPEITHSGDFMDFLDEAWLRDVFGPWDYESNMGLEQN